MFYLWGTIHFYLIIILESNKHKTTSNPFTTIATVLQVHLGYGPVQYYLPSALVGRSDIAGRLSSQTLSTFENVPPVFGLAWFDRRTRRRGTPVQMIS